MTSFVRRIVSGYKARFRDDASGVDLDLIYLTDQVIIMGGPTHSARLALRSSKLQDTPRTASQATIATSATM